MTVGSPVPAGAERLDSWLESFHGERLALIDRQCAASAGPERFALFGDLDASVWGMLLTQQYEVYPHIKALLPDVPAPEFQQLWTGRSGLALASQSTAFYTRLREVYLRHGCGPLGAAEVLDFGCGWGRLTRFLARDVAPGRLYGCDPLAGTLDVCRETRVPAVLAQSDFLPERLPFDASFDLAFAFSVFTHLSEPAHERCLAALHRGLRPGGILVVTIRPPAYAELSEPLQEVAGTGAPYRFAAYRDGLWGQQGGDYGETIVTMDYVRDRWDACFELLEVGHVLEDPYQVILALRRR